MPPISTPELIALATMPAYQVLRWTVLPGGPRNPFASLDVVEQAALRSGRMLAAIDACQPWVRAWLYLAYGAVRTAAHLRTLIDHLPCPEWDPTGVLRYVVVHDEIEHAHGRERLDEATVAAILGMGQARWAREGRRAYKALQWLVWRWDDAGIAAVERARREAKVRAAPCASPAPSRADPVPRADPSTRAPLGAVPPRAA